MAKKKAKRKPARKAAPKAPKPPETVHFAVVYEIHSDGAVLVPGDVLEVPLKEVNDWRPFIESRALKRVEGEDEALATADEIVSGGFVLSEEVSGKQHSIAHGGFGTPKKRT